MHILSVTDNHLAVNHHLLCMIGVGGGEGPPRPPRPHLDFRPFHFCCAYKQAYSSQLLRALPRGTHTPSQAPSRGALGSSFHFYDVCSVGSCTLPRLQELCGFSVLLKDPLPSSALFEFISAMLLAYREKRKTDVCDPSTISNWKSVGSFQMAFYPWFLAIKSSEIQSQLNHPVIIL